MGANFTCTYCELGSEEGDDCDETETMTISFGQDEFPDMPLDTEMLRSVEQSWQLIRVNMRETAAVMFHRLLVNPEMDALFEQASLMPSHKGEWRDAYIQSHSMTVMASINEVICNLRDPDEAARVLYEIGGLHARFQHILMGDFFEMFEEPFLYALREVLGERFTSKLERAYKLTMQYMITIVQIGFIETGQPPQTQLVQDSDRPTDRHLADGED